MACRPHAPTGAKANNFDAHKSVVDFFSPSWLQENDKDVNEMKNKITAFQESNQNAKADAGKPRPSLVPTQIILDIAQVREYGNKKYGSSENWKNVEMQRYVDALLRHTICFVNDPKSKDSESGIEHYKHMACNMAFICSMMTTK